MAHNGRGSPGAAHAEARTLLCESVMELHGLKKVPRIAVGSSGSKYQVLKRLRNRGSMRTISGNIAGKPGTLV